MKHNQWYDDDKIGKKIKCGSLGSYAAIAAVKDRLGTEPGENMNIQNWADEMSMMIKTMMMVRRWWWLRLWWWCWWWSPWVWRVGACIPDILDGEFSKKDVWNLRPQAFDILSHQKWKVEPKAPIPSEIVVQIRQTLIHRNFLWFFNVLVFTWVIFFRILTGFIFISMY